ncbi:MAG: zf-HC2 domain-containing protein, partial [Acidobacteriota bacterium]
MGDRHPSFETLLDLTLGDLPAEQADEVREHLTQCDPCRRQVEELLDESEEPPEGLEPVTDTERQAAWEEFTDALVEEGLIPEADKGKPSTGRVTPFPRPEPRP